MSEFRYEPEFPIVDIDYTDKRFMSRLDMEKMEKNIDVLSEDIARRGQIDPVGIARLVKEEAYIIIYGFTRTAAIRKLGWEHIKANVYDKLPEQEARALNAANNSMREDLNPWERALQIKRLRLAGIPVNSDEPNRDTVCKLLKMSRGSVFNWLKVVEYPCPALHKAIASGDVALRHALEFADYDPPITISVLKHCIDEEWTSSELRLRLQSPTLDSQDELVTQHTQDSSTLDGQDEAIENEDIPATRAIEKLRRAGTYLMRVNEADIESLDTDAAVKLHDGLKAVLSVIVS